ncbi:MAG: type II secretion system F family protein [Actinomycetota bacterium]
MNPLVAAVAVTGCYVLALLGLRLATDPGPISRFQVAAGESESEQREGLIPRMVGALSESLVPSVMRLMGRRRLDAVRRRLDEAGRPGGLTLPGYVGRKALFGLLFGAVGVLFLLDGQLLVFVLLALSGWLLMDVWLAGVARRRRAAIDRDLPDFLDIVSVTVRAGSGLRPALTRVSEAMAGPLGEEVTTALRQMDFGASRREAFEDLRRRNSSESLSQFVTALLQAEELGVPLSDAIADLATDMRRVFHQQARRRAARADPRVNLIVTTLIVPGALILIVAALLVSTDVDISNLFGPQVPF